MSVTSTPSAKRTTPALIRRNTLLLAATQAFVGIGNQMVPTLGALMVIRLLGSATFAGVATSILSLSRFLIAYPIGWVADTVGRRAAMMIGLTLSLVGALLLGAAATWLSFPLFLFGLLIFGLGVGAGQQLRLAAADLYPPDRRAEGLGYVLTGSLLGALGGPILITFALSAAPDVGLDPSALVWLLVPCLLIPSMGLILLVRPDPREIAKNLQLYYPDANLESDPSLGKPTSATFRAWIGFEPMRIAFVASFAAQGVMSLMMAMTPIALAHHGHELPMISLAIALHVVGMFGFSIPLGHLTDRAGRRFVLIIGSVFSALGAVSVVSTDQYAFMTFGIFLVGLGWSCISVASTALIADLTLAEDRGRAIGINDSISGAGAIALPLIGGFLVDIAGLPVLAVLSLGLMLIPIAMLVRMNKDSTGHFVRARTTPADL